MPTSVDARTLSAVVAATPGGVTPDTPPVCPLTCARLSPQVTEPAPLGCYVHGLVLEGARWDREEGRLKDSAPGELHQQMPVIQVQPPPRPARPRVHVWCQTSTQRVALHASRHPTPLPAHHASPSPLIPTPPRAHSRPATAQVRPVTADEHDLAGCYQCPVYTNMQRANVYSACVSTFTLKTAEAPHKWVLASVALLLQDDLA